MMESDNLNCGNTVLSDEKTTHVLKERMELRFEVAANSLSVVLRLETGSAELFGTQLAPMRDYKITPSAKVAVFTFYGCTLNIFGKVDNVYTSENTPMVMYVNLHEGLNQMRESAESETGRGPRIVVAGTSDAGKDTLCKILVNYATRMGWCPMLVDLDVGQNDISIPGTIAALPLCQPADIEEGYVLGSPLVYHFGHTSPDYNAKLYDLLVQKLADAVNIYCEVHNACNVSGAVINACGYIKKEGYQWLLNVINVFEPNVVVVLEHELLYNNLTKDVPDYVKVLSFPRPGGVFDASQEKVEERNLSIRKYFYGITNNLSPHIFDVKFSEVQIYKITPFKMEVATMPLGMANKEVSSKLVPIKIGTSLQYQVMSASQALSKDDDIIQANVAGFVVVNNVDMEKQLLTLLSPKPRPFSWNIFLLMEGFTFTES